MRTILVFSHRFRPKALARVLIGLLFCLSLSATVFSMPIFVQTPAGVTLPLDIEATDTIDRVKMKIEETEGIPFDRQRLFFSEQQLEDGRTIADYNIQKNNTLQLIILSSLVIRPETDADFTIVRALSDSVLSVKELIRDRDGIATDCQRLVFAGNILEDDKTLNEYGILDGSTLQLVVIYPISIEPETGDAVTIFVASSDKISTLKTVIQNQKGISSESQRLIFDGKQLEDSKTLADYNIQNNSSIQLVLVFPISVRPAIGNDVTIVAASSDTISTLKESINGLTGVSTDSQRLIFQGQRLENDKTVADYAIQKDSAIQFIPLSEIQVKPEDGEAFTLHAALSDTVSELRAVIRDLKGISSDRQRLIFDGKQLSDTGTLADSNIQDGSLIQLVLLVPISIMPETGESFILLLAQSDLISMLKMEIQTLKNIASESQRIFLEGNQLVDEKSLADYGLQAESILRLVIFTPAPPPVPPLPPVPPVPPAPPFVSIHLDMPIPDLRVPKNELIASFSLFPYFHDEKYSDNELIYEVMTNDHADIATSSPISSADGQLALSLLRYGSTRFDIRATNRDGDSILASFSLAVDLPRLRGRSLQNLITESDIRWSPGDPLPASFGVLIIIDDPLPSR